MDIHKILVPVGRSDFADIRKNGYYYIDKSSLIKELLQDDGVQVTLITRPRRFGKTLAMDMLYNFFDIRKDSLDLFKGLSIFEDQALCSAWMNQSPTLFLSLKSVDGADLEGAYEMIVSAIAELYQEHLYLMDSDKLHAFDKRLFYRIASKEAGLAEIKNSLASLIRMMASHYGRPVILLLDEYDVPLAKASEKGYYKEMLDVMKGLMQAVKDNRDLRSAVVTGCLKIAKESIFTGTNNFVSDTVSDTRIDRYFGFTQAEVDRLLLDTGLSEHASKIREWYDGYRFGRQAIYCPWDVMNYVRELLFNPSSLPKNFWENTSDNAIIRTFLDRTSFDVKEKFEALLAGGYVQEPITETLTYDTLGATETDLWSILYFTGYLTRAEPQRASTDRSSPGRLLLKIPNREGMEIFRRSVTLWFTDRSTTSDRRELFDALWAGDDRKLTTLLSDLLFDTISYHDYQETFYHAFLTGLVSNAGFAVESNSETGLGRADLVIKDRKGRRAVVIEAKWVDKESGLQKACGEALQQIEDRQYAKKIQRAGFNQVQRLGIAFWKKTCLVKSPES